MNTERIIKSTQEQAVASWIDYLNQLRLDTLLAQLARQDINLENALHILDELKVSISRDVIEKNRGGSKGMHGFIAERMQVAFENARNAVKGKPGEYRLIDDNGPDDYLRGDTPLQQKFVQKNLSLDAVKEHLNKYPDFLNRGGKYQIPKDYYDRIIKLFQMSEEEAKHLDKESYRLYKYIQEFFSEKGISIDDIEPTVMDYSAAQAGKADETVETQKDDIKERDQKEREKAYQKSKPGLKEGAKAAGMAAAIEGGTTFCMGVLRKRKQGKKLAEFTEEDWQEIGIDTAKGTGKGAVRGAVVYAMTNFTTTPDAVASGLVTAAFGIAAEHKKLKDGTITQEEFLVNSEVLSLDVTVGAVAALLGSTLIPVPVLGAVIGSMAGNFVYEIVKDMASAQEAEWIKTYNQQMSTLEQYLDVRYQMVLQVLEAELKKYKSLIEMAFSKDVNEAFQGSIELARHVGVPENKILKNRKEINTFFLKRGGR